MVRTLVLCCVLICVSAQCSTYNYKNFTLWPELCHDSESQSPVDVETSSARNFTHFIFPVYSSWKSLTPTLCPCCLYTIPLSASGSSLMLKDLNGQSLIYKPAYVAIHSPSEHTFGGEHFDVEVQIYHSLYAGSSTFITAAVSLFFSATSDTDSPFFAQFVDSVAGTPLLSIPTFSLASVISQMTSFNEYFLYEGSLTVPPCDENVLWVLIAYTDSDEQKLSAAQLQAFTKLWQDGEEGGNNRPTQDLGSRRIYHKSKF